MESEIANPEADLCIDGAAALASLFGCNELPPQAGHPTPILSTPQFRERVAFASVAPSKSVIAFERIEAMFSFLKRLLVLSPRGTNSGAFYFGVK
jgi:hypothetical protein